MKPANALPPDNSMKPARPGAAWAYLTRLPFGAIID